MYHSLTLYRFVIFTMIIVVCVEVRMFHAFLATVCRTSTIYYRVIKTQFEKKVYATSFPYLNFMDFFSFCTKVAFSIRIKDQTVLFHTHALHAYSICIFTTPFLCFISRTHNFLSKFQSSKSIETINELMVLQLSRKYSFYESQTTNRIPGIEVCEHLYRINGSPKSGIQFEKVPNQILL